MAHTVGGDIYSRVYDWDNLIRAYDATRSTKKYCHGALKAHDNYVETLVRIRDALRDMTWEPKPYREFTTFNSHKMRRIEAPAYEDRIVHNALMQVIEAYVEPRFIADSYACRKGKGTHKAADRLQTMLRGAGQGAYVLKCDVSKHFPTIWREFLFDRWAHVFRDWRMLWLIERASVRPDAEPSLRGVPVGAHPSQLNSNLSLDPLDHFVIECIGVLSYVRYADDFIVIDRSKERLHKVKADIEWFLQTQLKQRLNPKTSIFPARHGVDFCGYRIWATHRRPRKKVVKNFKRYFRGLAHNQDYDGMRKLWASFCGYMKHCNGKATMMLVLPYVKKGV